MRTTFIKSCRDEYCSSTLTVFRFAPDRCSEKSRNQTEVAETGLNKQCDLGQVVCKMGFTCWAVGESSHGDPLQRAP